MDQQTSGWIIEFLLRQQVDDNILESLLSVLPLNNDDPRLKKALLLRTIQTEVATATVSEKILELLELVGELDFREGKVEPLESMKAAYCAVAVDCTVKFLGLGNNLKYYETFKRFWKVRVGKMEKSENPGLISDRLWSWRDDLQAASSDSEICDKILSRNTRNEALTAVRGYLAEAWDEIGPSFVEKTAENVVKMGMTGQGINEIVEEEGSEDVIMVDDETNPNDRPSVETQQKQGLPSCSQAGANVGCSRGGFNGTRSKVTITNIEEVDIDTSTNMYSSIPTHKVDKIVADLKSSFAALRAVVTDPLPEALRIAEGVVADMHKDIGCSDDRPKRGDSRNGSDPSPTVPNPSSNSDPLEFSEELPPRIRLNTPVTRKISPLKLYEMKKLTRRRTIKKWSALEEDTLRDGIKKYGRGNWKVILDAYRDIFEERTDVDLKDKWRNMTRYSKHG